MSSIRWIRNVLIDGEKSTLEIMVGSEQIADKCYVRMNRDLEIYFRPAHEDRDSIIEQGIEILKRKLSKNEVLAADGSSFGWI